MLKYDAVFDAWLFVEWSSRKLYIELYNKKDITAVFWHLQQNGFAVRFDSEVLPINPRPRLLLYCVTWAKHALGIDAWWVITPYQLKCELIRRGGSVMFDETIEENV